MNPTGRYVLRCFLVGVAGFVASLQASSAGSSLNSGELLQAVLAGVSLALTYAGIGYVSANVEPHIGKTAPPADA